MGTIQKRRRADGSLAYRAEIRLKRGGRVIHQESRTFDYHGHAQGWIKRREAELDAPGALLGSPRLPFANLAQKYVEYIEALGHVNRSKLYAFDRVIRAPIGGRPAGGLVAADVIEYARMRASEGAGPSTVGAEIGWIGEVLRMARPVFDIHVDARAVDEARSALSRLRLIGKSRVRVRRLECDEGERLFAWFSREDGRAHIPMVDVMGFALESAFRLGEIVKLRRVDVNKARRTVIIRDRKDPKGRGRDEVAPLMGRSLEIIERQPVIDDVLVFPYKKASIGARFQRACKKCSIVDLRFHDLRREAATRMLERGHSIPEVIAATGHRDWNQFRRYVGIRPDEIRPR